MSSNATTASTNLPPRWKHHAQVFPPADEIAHALQDKGKEVSTKQKGLQVVKHRYPLIERLAMKIYTKIFNTFNKPDCLTKNASRGKYPLVHEIILA